MRSRYKVGDWVQVLSREEILATLDANGELDGMLFMPEMFQFCGKTYEVVKRAHKSCDYTTPQPYRSRWVDGAVFLETRCDGSAHGGCQADCRIFWKEAWLRPAQPQGAQSTAVRTAQPAAARCDELRIVSRTQTTDPADGSIRYTCQTTELPRASAPLAWWDLRQYLEDVQSGNITIGRLLTGFIYSVYYHTSSGAIIGRGGKYLGPPLRWLYNKARWIWGGSLFPRTPGRVPDGQPTPAGNLNLREGELVRVKSHQEILDTVNTRNLNRGMYWDAELVPYCGGTYRVLRSVTRLIDEKTGKLLVMKNPCIMLDSVLCEGRYSSCRMFCPKGMYPYWRESWLERVEEPRPAGAEAEARKDVVTVA